MRNGKIVLASLFVIASSQVQAQIVTNGSFENVQIGSPFYSLNSANVPGWTHTGDVGDAFLWAKGYVDSGGVVTVTGDGNQFATMGGGVGAGGTGHWEQTLTGLTPSATYNLSFKMAAEYIIQQSITVDFPTGSSTASQTFTAQPASTHFWQNWETKTMTFVPTSTSVNLRFSATTLYDVGLDSIVVTSVATSVPEPNAFAIFASIGTTGIGFFAHRRRSIRKGGSRHN